MDWETAILIVTIGLAALIYGTMLYLHVSRLVAYFRKARAVERMLDSVPDVPYLPLPESDQQQAWSSCVICIAEYGRGEGRFVMPGCGHAFHRGCVAKWLRQGKTTCPICRATAVVVVPPAGEEKTDAVSTAENMV